MFNKIIYRVRIKDSESKLRPAYSVRKNGLIVPPPRKEWEEYYAPYIAQAKANGNEESVRYFQERISESLEFAQSEAKFLNLVREEPCGGIGSWTFFVDERGGLINPRYEEAYHSLCLTFKGDMKRALSDFEIEYFGEGEPWEPDPNFDPDVILD